jgi:peptide/nickel transport system permease protein
MLRYLIRRTLFMVLVLVIVSFLTFLIFFKLPAGDPARLFAGRVITPETLALVRHNLGLDRPWWVQYWRFAKGLIPWPGLFLNKQVYYSYGNDVPVAGQIWSRLPVTLALTIGSAILWLLMGIPLGIISAIKRGSFADRAGMLFALAGVSIPVFWLGYVLLFVFWFKLGWLPGSGIPINETVIQAVLAGRFILPWIALAFSFAAFYLRMIRGNLIETMEEDYIRTARAKGLAERRVIFKHGVRSALTPCVTIFGLDIATLLGGAVITETVFNLPGIGQYTLQSIQSQDLPAVMGVTVFAAFFIVIANLGVDIAYAFLDPRVRYD